MLDGGGLTAHAKNSPGLPLTVTLQCIGFYNLQPLNYN